MKSIISITKITAFIIFTTLLTACGGSSNSTEPVVSDATTPTSTTITANSNSFLTVSGKADANSTVTATFPDASQKSTVADANGNYTLTSTTRQPAGQVQVTSNNIGGNTSEPAILDEQVINKVLYKATGVMPELSFIPSLGVNTEAPQGGADTSGMPMPFVDIFRTARPFTELSPPGTTFSENGWPTEFAAGQTHARTKLLQGALRYSIPDGQYTVLYDDTGRLEFGSSGTVTNIKKITGEKKYTFDLALKGFDGEDEVAAADTNAINMNIRDISSGNGNYMKNIRIVMPGGTCTGNPFLRVESASECPNGSTYESFVDRLANNRNAIIFNPDYLLFLRNFKVIRMMNLMEASLKRLCFTADNCPVGVGTWDHRAKIDDAVWGGNDGRTADEDHKGVPVEVMISLANTLQRDIWINIPHVASDDYVNQYAKQVFSELDTSLKVYLEYSNEVWNSGFAGYSYTTSEGNKLNLNTIPAETQQYCNTLSDENRGNNQRCHGDYYARLRFYSQHAVEIFNTWNTEFGGSNARLVRVLGSFVGDTVLTERMLQHISTNDIDSVAIAPYFYGCPYPSACPKAAKSLRGAITVDDVFDVIDQPGKDINNPNDFTNDIDVKSLEGTINTVKKQLSIVNQNNLELVSYEGGQHLVTTIFGGQVVQSDKPRLRKLFNDANRDPRMKERYFRFLNAWKDLSENGGASLFTIYTMPQSYYRFGNFGIKEHLNQPRVESPKYDGVMSFQENAGNCWWTGC